MKEWIWQIGVMKGVRIVIQVIVGWLIAHGVEKLGITINVDVLTIAAIGALEVLRNKLKTKFGWTWL